MMAERGVTVDPSTIWRWVRRYAPQLEEIRRYQGYSGPAWRVDETCVRVKARGSGCSGRSTAPAGRLTSCSPTDATARPPAAFSARRSGSGGTWPPSSITTDKNPAYGRAIAELKRRDQIPPELEHRQAKYLNNRLEADHGPIKRLCRATLGFKPMKSACATIKGFEVLRMIRKRQCIGLEPGVAGEVRFLAKLFGVPA
jgi:transposase, IS6 family